MIEQILIAICGVGSTWLSQDTRHSHQRWACILGLLAQPAWFYSAWQAQQWGIFGLAFVYTWCWARGVYNFWMRPATPRQPGQIPPKAPPHPLSRGYQPNANLTSLPPQSGSGVSRVADFPPTDVH